MNIYYLQFIIDWQILNINLHINNHINYKYKSHYLTLVNPLTNNKQYNNLY